MIPNGGSSQRGFTLVEVVVCVALIAVGLTTILAGMNLTARAVDRHAKVTRGTLVGREVMERFLGREDLQPDAAQDGETTTAEGTFRWEATAKAHDGGFPLGTRYSLLLCTVKVSWQETLREGETQSLSFATLEVRKTPQ